MGHWTKALVIFLLAITRLTVLAVVEPGDNREHFDILCSIYTVANNPPAALYTTGELGKDKDEINNILAALSDDEWFAAIEKATSESELPREAKEKTEEMGGSWEEWKKSVGEVGRKKELEKLPGDLPVVKLARRRVEKIRLQANTVVADMLAANRTGEVDKVAQLFKAAIYGEGKDESNADYATATSRQQTCGDGSSAGFKKKGDKAGATLVIDMLCLCAGLSSYGQPDACAKGAGNNGGGQWSGNGANGATAWGLIKTACQKGMTASGNRPGELPNLLAAFEVQLRRGFRSSESTKTHYPGMLGSSAVTTSKQPGCNGDNRDNAAGDGVCVYYGADGWDQNIAWLQKLTEAMKIIRQAAKKNTSINNDIKHLQMLRGRAEEVYEEAKATVEQDSSNPGKSTKRQSQNQNPNTPADKTMAQDPNAVNTAHIPRFILPWTLLI